MAKIMLRENDVMAIETRRGLYIIAQALKNRTMVFFNIFTTLPHELVCNLEEAKVLCCITPVKYFFDHSEIIKLKIQPATNVASYRTQDHLAFEPMAGFEKVTIYGGTKDELTILTTMGELRLVNWRVETLKHLDKSKDRAIIDTHQLETMGTWGELNERLYLSYRYDKYVEPTLDLQFGYIPIEYKTYFQIISNQIDEEVWKNLPIEKVLY